MTDCAFGCEEHLNALGYPEVRQALMDLDTNWKNMARWERGEVLIGLVSCGCSARGLSSLLPCSSRTIRHYMDLADLKLFQSKGRAGFTPERFFRHWEPLPPAPNSEEPTAPSQAEASEPQAQSSEAA